MSTWKISLDQNPNPSSGAEFDINTCMHASVHFDWRQQHITCKHEKYVHHL